MTIVLPKDQQCCSLYAKSFSVCPPFLSREQASYCQQLPIGSLQLENTVDFPPYLLTLLIRLSPFYEDQLATCTGENDTEGQVKGQVGGRREVEGAEGSQGEVADRLCTSE